MKRLLLAALCAACGAAPAAVPVSPADLRPTRDAPVRVEKADREALRREIRAWMRRPAEEMAPHPSAALFPGAVPTNAPRVTRDILVPLNRPRWTSTGLYAAPGEAIRVHLAPADTARGLRVRIGAHTDKLFELGQWRRMPEISRSTALTSTVTAAATPFGGLVYIDVPRDPALGGRQVPTYGGYGWIGEDPAAVPGVLTVRIEGAVSAPLYEHGRTTAADWQTIRARPAPWGELATDRIILTVPAPLLATLDDPAALMDFWNSVMDSSADLAGWPHARTSPERIVADVQISAGHMHSGYPIMCHLPQARDLLNLAQLRQQGDWGFFHEIGHNHQPQAITFDGDYVETTVNLFTMHTMETVVKRDRRAHGALENVPGLLRRRLASPPQTGPFENLAIYLPLIEAFGWDPLREAIVDVTQRRDPRQVATRAARIDAWVEALSRHAGRDLGPYFELFGLSGSAALRTTLASLPKWEIPAAVQSARPHGVTAAP